ncbi:hypothetical protein C8Q77DRAFT_1071454 [Trametes polyzona]|nr:hypothetical protein C8Q77DRAFT_1071454 [Trametes polyzona]
MVYNQHAFLTRRPDNLVVMLDQTTNRRHHYSVEQLRLYSRFDSGIRDGSINGPTDIALPAGYREFCRLWGQDDACPFHFSDYEPTAGLISIERIHLPVDELAPLVRAAGLPVQAPAAALGTGPTYSTRRQAIVDDLIWGQLERDMRGREAYRQHIDKRRSADTNHGAVPLYGGKRPRRQVHPTVAATVPIDAAAPQAPPTIPPPVRVTPIPAHSVAGPLSGASTASPGGAREDGMEVDERMVSTKTRGKGKSLTKKNSSGKGKQKDDTSSGPQAGPSDAPLDFDISPDDYLEDA